MHSCRVHSFYSNSSDQLNNALAERLASELSELEALLTEGDTYESNAKCYTKYEVQDGEYLSAEKEEEEVKEGALSLEENGLVEGLENSLCKLEILLTEGDTYDSKAECKAKNAVYCSEDESAEYAPKEITEFFHCDVLLEKSIFFSTSQF